MVTADDVFKLCKRTRLSTDEKALLFAATALVNRDGENVLHYYIKRGGCDYELMDHMIENGHTLDNYNTRTCYSPFQTAMLLDHESPADIAQAYRFERVNWLLKHDCPLVKSNDKHELARFLFERCLWEGDARRRHQVPSEPFVIHPFFVDFLKRMVAEDRITTDLTAVAFNPAYHTDDIDHLEWFSNTFTIDWSVPHMGNPIYDIVRDDAHGTCHFEELLNPFAVIKWLIKRHSEYVADGLALTPSLLYYCLGTGTYELLVAIYDGFVVPQDVEDAAWAMFTRLYGADLTHEANEDANNEEPNSDDEESIKEWASRYAFGALMVRWRNMSPQERDECDKCYRWGVEHGKIASHT